MIEIPTRNINPKEAKSAIGIPTATQKAVSALRKINRKKRTNIRPIGFITGLKKIMLSTSNGRVLQIDISTGKTEKILKIDSDKISRPFVFNKEIIIIKNNSIIRMN